MGEVIAFPRPAPDPDPLPQKGDFVKMLELLAVDLGLARDVAHAAQLLGPPQQPR